jgi:hypothetical protein
MKKALKIIGISILILIIFRGFIYRLTMKYRDIGTRKEIVITHKDLIEIIEVKAANRTINIEEIIEIAYEITNEVLEFTGDQASNNPNVLIKSNQANCVGYAAMFNSITNYLIKKNTLEREIEATHKIGELNMMGLNLHKLFKSSFFKDHDFNEIINKKTGKVISIDPSVSDYLWIKRVATTQEENE